MSRGTCCSFSLPRFRPRLVGQATQGAVLKKFSVPQPTPALRALLLGPGSLRPKKSFSVRLQAVLSLQASLQRLAQPVIFRPPSPPNLLNMVLSALENCLPGLMLEKYFLYLYFGQAILSSGTLYTTETTRKLLTCNALKMLSDQNSFHFHVTSLQQSPSLFFLFLLVYCSLSLGFQLPSQCHMRQMDLELCKDFYCQQ